MITSAAEELDLATPEDHLVAESALARGWVLCEDAPGFQLRRFASFDEALALGCGEALFLEYAPAARLDLPWLGGQDWEPPCIEFGEGGWYVTDSSFSSTERIRACYDDAQDLLDALPGIEKLAVTWAAWVDRCTAMWDETRSQEAARAGA